MSNTPEFDFRSVFSEGEQPAMPTSYDRLGLPPPETWPSETKIRTASEVFTAYRDVMANESLPGDVQERVDIELSTFMDWMKLTDEEYELAQVEADKDLKEGE